MTRQEEEGADCEGVIRHIKGLRFFISRRVGSHLKQEGGMMKTVFETPL